MSTEDPRLTIVLTGGSSGIGAALTVALAGDGHRVFACARRSDRLAEVTKGGTLATPFTCDVSDEADVKRFVAAVVGASPRIDVLINAAGIYGEIGLAHEADSAKWMQALQTNLLGTFSMTKHVVPYMAAERRPRVINFAGGGAFQPLPRFSAYAVSKAAVVRLTETQAVELAPRNVMVNAVAPGFVVTEIHEATLAAGPERAGPELFAMTQQKLREGAVPMDTPVGLVRFLLSRRADGITGKTISASFDPWWSDDFTSDVHALAASELYTMKRIDLKHLSPSELRSKLLTASGQREMLGAPEKRG